MKAHATPQFAAFALGTLCVCLAATSAPADSVLTDEQMAAVQRAEAQRIEVIKKVQPTVVVIYGKDRRGSGSGVVVTEDGLALTNYHVVVPTGGSGWAGLADGNLYPWKVVGQDPGGDIALIQLSGKEKFETASLGDSDSVRVGQWVMAMGNPFMLADDNTPTVTLGIVSAVHRFQKGAGGNMLVYGDCIQIDSSINPGNSGGPLFDMNGQLLGINGRGSFEERGRVNVGVGYAITLSQIRNFYADLLATKICQHATLDMAFETREGDVVCSKVDIGEDPPLMRAGMQLGDRLLKFNGYDIHHANDLLNHMSTIPAGWPVEVTFESRGQAKTVQITPKAQAYGNASRQAAPRQPQPRPGMPRIPWMPVRAEKPQQKPGEITDADMNRAHAERIIRDLGQLDPAKHDAATRAFIESYKPDDLSTFASLVLEGGDRLWGHRAFRIAATTADGRTFRLWVTVFDKDGRHFEHRLMKVETRSIE